MNYPAPLITARTEALPIYIWTAGERHLQDDRNRPNGTPFHHLLFVLEGEMVLRTPTGEAVYPAGTALYLPKNMPMFYGAANGRLVTGWLAFDGYAVNGLLSYFHIDGVCAVSAETLIPQYELCVTAVKKGKSHEKISALLYSALISFFSLSAPVPEHFKQACAFIRENATKDLSIPDIAEAVGISPSLLYHLFKQEKTTPLAYLNTHRIEMAKRKLLEGGDTIAQIGSDCGFHDRAYFCKIFRRLTGVSPNKFRKEYR